MAVKGSSVYASAVSAYTYGKNKNIDIRNGFVMMIAILVFTFVGAGSPGTGDQGYGSIAAAQIRLFSLR